MVKMEINPAKRKGGIAKGIRLMIEKIKNLAMKIFDLCGWLADTYLILTQRRQDAKIFKYGTLRLYAFA